jgi:threonyl-tRNA synthetase
MLTRIYGLAFETKEELDAYLTQRIEAEKRDHKKIGPAMGLFTFSNLVGPGLPMFLPKGGTIVRELEEFVREEKIKRGYSFVRIPHIAKTALYKKSGHLGKYDAMMPIMKDQEGMEMVLKAMNCPHHFELYNSQPHSYRELPLRFAETTTVYRNEKSGELAGLLRVKALTQDDTHHFVRHDQIESEIEMILGLMSSVYKVFGFSEFLVQISVRDPKNKEKYFGGDELWEKSEKILIEGVKKWGKPYIVEEGEAAFYGPKIDIMVKDAIGRMWQLTTVQLDFNQPENFDMSYVGVDGQKHRPAVLHVAILGSVERFLGVLIEHYAGIFPLWLSPVQVKVIPVRTQHNEYAKKIFEMLKENNIRAEFDDSDINLGTKVRDAKNNKIPYWIVVGDKEIEADKVTLESRDNGQLGQMDKEELVKKLLEEIRSKK